MYTGIKSGKELAVTCFNVPYRNLHGDNKKVTTNLDQDSDIRNTTRDCGILGCDRVYCIPTRLHGVITQTVVIYPFVVFRVYMKILARG
jgi:hypothetical protein